MQHVHDLYIPFSAAELLATDGALVGVGRAMIEIPPGRGIFIPDGPLATHQDALENMPFLVRINGFRPFEASQWRPCDNLIDASCGKGLHFHFVTVQRYV